MAVIHFTHHAKNLHDWNPVNVVPLFVNVTPFGALAIEPENVPVPSANELAYSTNWPSVDATGA
jgi:hypothetical protein